MDIWRRLCEFSRSGARLHVLATVRRQPDRDAVRELSLRAAQVDFVARRASLGAALGSEPFQFASRTALSAAPLWPEYDLVVLEQEFGAPILRNPALRYRKLVVRVHNDEAVFASETARSISNPLLKAHFRAESRRLGRCSPPVLRLADHLWFISHDDCRSWIAQNPDLALKASWLPPPLDPAGFARSPLAGRTVLFAGNLLAPANLEGINWYLEAVHPRLRAIPGYALVIAGSLLGRSLGSRLRVDPFDASVEVVTDSPDLAPWYASACVFINPMRHGAGLKLKTINAVERGLPVVTTSTANEGTGMQDGAHALIRDSPAGFADAVRALLLDDGMRRRYAAAAQDFLCANYDHTAKIAEFLRDLAGEPAAEPLALAASHVR